MRTPQTIESKTTIHAPDPRISALVDALASPPLSAPNAHNIGIKLKGHTKAQLRSGYFHDYFTDSGDTIEVWIRLRSGDVLSIVSNSQMPLMLPWVIYGAGAPITTYDANVARAIFALLPKNAPSRQVFDVHGMPGDFYWEDPGTAARHYRADGNGGECIRDYVARHPNVHEKIHFNGELSLSHSAQAAFLLDEYRAGHTGIIDEVAGQLQLYTWLTLTDGTSTADWIVGPNNPTILWRHTGPTTLGAGNSKYCSAVTQ